MSCLVSSTFCSLWAQELLFQAFWDTYTMLKKGVEGWAPAIFLASGVVAPPLEGWVVAPGSFYSAEFCNPPLWWKLEWGLLGTQQATFQLNGESRKFSSDTFIPSWLDKFAKLKTVRKRGSFCKNNLITLFWGKNWKRFEIFYLAVSELKKKILSSQSLFSHLG